MRFLVSVLPDFILCSYDHMFICYIFVGRTSISANLPEIRDDDPRSTLRYIGIKALVLLSNTSTSIKAMVDQVLQDKWNRALSRFVKSPMGLRDILRGTDAVVSGSMALHFILDGPELWEPNDADIFAPLHAADKIANYLMSSEAFKVEGMTSRNARYQDHIRFNPSIARVVYLIRPDGFRLQIIESATPTALHPLAHFWSTLVTNYISADAICVVFPSLTFNKRGCSRLDILDNDAEIRAIEKYRARGFTISDFDKNVGADVNSLYPGADRDCDLNPNCPHRLRYIGDQWCLQTVFDEGNAEFHVPDSLVPQWRYGGALCGTCGVSSTPEVNLLLK